ncbi:MAG: hypothetical protein IPJ32_08525 [Sphingobacteriaceae bacterium]|nr:hypothetical protein [Sphingobacteriaceae bacterium]
MISFGKAYAIILICTSVFILTFFKNFSRYMAMYFLAPIRNGVVRDLRNKLFKKTLDLPLSYYSNERKGDLMSRMTTDVQEVEWSIMQTLELIFQRAFGNYYFGFNAYFYQWIFNVIRFLIITHCWNYCGHFRKKFKTQCTKK